MPSTCFALPTAAHHSPAQFDMSRDVMLEGTIKEFSWRNPHSFAVIERTLADGRKEQWTFELNSTPVLQRWGWTRDTLRVGDRVVARGNPDNDAERRFLERRLREVSG